MNEKKERNKKDWIKNIAIIFLLIMLLLTLFSNTIKNYSLPVVTLINPSQTTIKEQARGTGQIEAGEKYLVKATETRKVASVAVKKGDHVEKGDVIYYLEEKASDELTKAKGELATLEADYLKALFDGTASDETIIKVRSGNFESLGSYQNRLAAINSKIEELKKRIAGYEDEYDVLTITNLYNGTLLNTYSVDNILARLKYEQEEAKIAFEEEKNRIIYELQQDGSYLTDKSLSDYEIYLRNIDGSNYSTLQELASAISYETYVKTVTENNNKAQEAKVNANAKAIEQVISNAKSELKDLENEKTVLVADIAAEIKLEKYNSDIEAKQAEVSRLEAEAMGATITAPVSGIVDSLALVAGEDTAKDKDVCSLIMDGKGYSLTISVEKKQADRVNIGDVGEPSNYWAYDDVVFTVKSIKDDPDSNGKNKKIEFAIDGTDLTVGQSVTISVGSKSQVYDLVVSNAAIRKSNGGSFVLVLTEKKTPFGKRYIASKVEVTERASDDTNTAISGNLNLYDYVIVSSTKPLADGEEFRIKEG